MKEIVSLHVGQFGVQVGNAIWELYCLEHDISPDGKLMNKNNKTAGFEAIFEENSNGSYSPRAIFTDLEPTVVNEVRTGSYKKLYNPEKLIHGKEDAASNYARGRYTVGRENIGKTEEAIRIEAEKCDRFASFLSFHSLGGGTGSGFNFLVDELLNDNYHKKVLIEVALFPSRQLSTSIVETYNAVLATNAVMDKTNCVIIIDNQALNGICQRRLDLDRVTYSTINRLIAQAVSTTTSTLRFESHQQTDLADFHTNLVPFPRLHFPIFSLSPINPVDKLNKATTNLTEMTINCFDQANRMAGCKNEEGSYMACSLTFRGNIPPTEIHQAIGKLKNNIRLVDWCPTGFKIGATFNLPVTVPRSEFSRPKCQISMLCNNTAMREVWENLSKKYQIMSRKGAFYHWYLGEGMDLEEFKEAGDNVRTLISDYKECDGTTN